MSQQLKEEVWKKIDAYKNNIIRFTCDLIKIPSENPPGDMTEIAEFIRNHLEKYGLHCKQYEPEKGKINLICSIGKNRNESNLVFNGHMDVVPVGEREKWDFPPFSGEVKNGYILGRGASDMKGGLAGIISVMELLAELEVELNGTLTLTLVPDEETGGKFGTGWLMMRGIIKPDACIVAEPTGLTFIDIGQRGALWIKITVRGFPTHGSLSPYKGENAILTACKVMNTLLRLIEVEVKAPDDIIDIVEKSKLMVEALIEEKGIGRILSSPTVNVGTIRGGNKINVVPDKCEMEVDIRLPIGFSVKEAEEKLEELLKDFKDDVSINVIAGIEPNYTSPTTRLVSLIKRNIKEILGINPDVFVQWASSDARYFRLKGIPTIHYGPAEVKGIHGYNERVRVEDVVTAAKVYAGVAIDFLA